VKVAIRVDSSSTIGSGHVVRCKALADELRRRGSEIQFICREHPGHFLGLLKDAGYQVASLPTPTNNNPSVRPDGNDYAAWLGVDPDLDATQTIDALDNSKPDWLITDHYGLDVSWESKLRPHVKRILAIDDLANRRHDCDLLLDQNWFGAETAKRYDGLVPEKCQRLLGPRYALLQPVFSQLRRCLPLRDGSLRRVLVFMGGVDSNNQTVEALRALSFPEFSDLAVDVVVGGANSNASVIEELAALRPLTTVYRGLPSLAGLMARADLMLGAGGITTWERCCLGLPAITVVASENQQPSTVSLAEDGVHLYLGLAADILAADWAQALQNLRQTPTQFMSYFRAMFRVTDGLGVYRLAAVMGGRPIQLSLRRATPEDEALLLEWANDTEVRRHSFSPQPISAQVHHEWYKKKLADPDCLLMIGQDACGLPVGQVRFDTRDGQVLVDVSIDCAMRGRGIGGLLIKAALEKSYREEHGVPVVADVLAVNQASRKMFENLGFHPVSHNERNKSIRYELKR
jgi:UDP-2,4-diacetamido-2,4,6-trideoxy-beta-L-altropyranose hydrolase